MKKNIIYFTTIFLCSFYSSAQQTFSPKSYICCKTDSMPVIDGRITEVSWQKAMWTDNFLDIEGTIQPTPRFRSRVKMLWDEKYFYIAAELEETDVLGTIVERDAVIFHDNDFELFIDPDGDTHQYYELEVNALNTVWDLLLIKPYRDGGPPVNGWDIQGLKTAVDIQGTVNNPDDIDKSWTVEIALPWEALKECAHRVTPPKSGDQWRVNFSRVEWKTEVQGGKYIKAVDSKTGKVLREDNWVWSPQGVINMHYPEMWGFVQFSENTIGKGEDKFIINPDESAKQILRQIYYGEQKYFQENSRYTADMHALGLSSIKVTGYSSPIIQVTSDIYEATIISLDGKAKWHILNDGKTWEE